MSVALLAALVSCANETDPEVDPAPPDTSTPTETENSPDPETPDDNVSVSLPSLPIGGNANESSDSDHPNNQCVDVNWIVDPDSDATLKAGVEIEITGFAFTPDGAFVEADAGCDDSNPPCDGFVFTEDTPVCNLAVEPTVDGAELSEDPGVAVTGNLNCTLGAEECEAFAAAANATAAEQDPIDLLFPELGPTEDTASPTDDLTETG